MKKLFFTTALFLLSISSFAQGSEPCDQQSTAVYTTCGIWCATVIIPFTYILEVDINLLIATNNTMRRKPTEAELVAALELAQLCS